MKRLQMSLSYAILALCAAAALSLTPTSVDAAAPTYVFNNGPDAARAEIGQGRVVSEFGLFNLQPQGTDLTLSVRMTQDEAFDSQEYPFFGLRYKATTKQKIGGLFFTTDGELKRLSDKSYSPFEIIGDGEWHDLVVDMREYPKGSWKDNITSFRLDPTNPSDLESRISISRFGFFKSDDDARAFLADANDAPNLALDTTIVNEVCGCVLPGGMIDVDYDRNAWLLDPVATTSLSDATSSNRAALVVARRLDDAVDVAPLCDVTSLGFVTYLPKGSGKWELIHRSVPVSDASLLEDKDAVEFVLARKLMTTDKSGAFRPNEKLSERDVERVKKALHIDGVQGLTWEKISSFVSSFEQFQKEGATRYDAALFLRDGVKEILGTRIESPYPKEYFTRDRIRIGAWGNFRASDFGDDYMRTYADCGFDFILPFVSVPTSELLKLCDKYGIEATVNDGSYRNPIAGTNEYVDHPSFTGCYVVDEPGSDDYDKLAKDCNNYTKLTGKRAYVNLLPMYANAAQLKYGAGAAAIEYYDSDPDLFRKYCASFCEKFDSDYICTDIYPFNWNNGKKTTYADYAESINVIASVAREYERDFWCYIQTFGWREDKRTPNEEEFRWQCYSMLSFGCKTILCWTYAGYKPEFPSLVDTESAQTSAWYDARAVFMELRRLSDVFVEYRNLGAFSHHCTEETPYLKFSNEYQDFDAIEEIDCDAPLLVGCFEKKDDSGAKAFTLVNMTEFQDALGVSARVKLNAESVVAWYRGVPTEVRPDDEGWFHFHLGVGDGVFVTLK